MRIKVKQFKILLLILAAGGALTFTNCEGYQSISVQEAILGSDGTVIPGVRLYNVNCSGCHNALDVSEKRGRTATQIQGAIVSVSDMRHLVSLSSVEISQIAEVLNMSTTPPPPSNRPSNYRPIVHNRYMLKSYLKDLFSADDGRDGFDTAIDYIIDNLIGLKSEAFGGNCSRNDADCIPTDCRFYGDGECLGRLGGHMQASPVPVLNTISQAYMVRTCEEVLEVNKAVHTALAKAGLTTDSPIDTANITQLIKHMHRDRPVGTAAVAKLLEQNAVAINNGYSTLDQWRFIMLPICISTTTDLL